VFASDPAAHAGPQSGPAAEPIGVYSACSAISAFAFLCVSVSLWLIHLCVLRQLCVVTRIDAA